MSVPLSQFFVICQPGFEDELLRELNEFWPFLIESDGRPNATSFLLVEKDMGGILIEAPPMLGVQINFFSRLATRVLLRVGEFRVRDFPKLHERFRKVKLEPFFGTEPFRVEVAASKSRLNNEKRILQVAREVWPKISDEAKPGLYIRMHDDLCSLSVDTSGEHLYKRRGEPAADDQKWVGEAPLRETAAAFIARSLINYTSVHELKNVTLWDPMAGSGTLISEAAQIFQPNFGRRYAFQDFPGAAKILKSTGVAGNYVHFERGFAQLWASDIDEKMLGVLRHNLEGISDRIFRADIFETPREEISNDLWMVLNPPYGERLALQKNFRQLGEALSRFRPARLAVLTPRGFGDLFEKGVMSEAHPMTLQRRLAFKNGGLPVEFSIFGKPSLP